MTIPLVRPIGLAQLTGRGATIFALGYFVAMAAFAFWSIDGVISPWPTVTGLLLFGLASYFLVRDKGQVLSRRVTATVIAIGIVTALLISWQVTGGSYTHWYYGATCMTLFFISLRGRVALAWWGYAAVSAVLAVAGATTSLGLWNALFLVCNQLPILIIGSSFALGLRHTGHRVQQVTTETFAQAAAEATAQATTAERASRLAALDEFVAPLLSKLVAGSTLTAEDRLEFAVAEAALRDGLRARGLDVPVVVTAARDARRRGVEVVLLDDSDPHALQPDDAVRAAEATAAALRSATDGQVTARLLPPGRDAIATIVVDGSRYERTDVSR